MCVFGGSFLVIRYFQTFENPASMILTNWLFLSTLCYLPCIYVQGSDWSPLDWEPVGHQKQLVPWGNDVRDIMGFYEKRLEDDAMQNHHQEQGVNVQVMKQV